MNDRETTLALENHCLRLRVESLMIDARYGLQLEASQGIERDLNYPPPGGWPDDDGWPTSLLGDLWPPKPRPKRRRWPLWK